MGRKEVRLTICPMRILFVDKSEYWGGAEASLKSTMAALSLEHEIYLLSQRPMLHHTAFGLSQGRHLYRAAGPRWWMYKRWPWRIKGLGLLERIVFGAKLGIRILSLRPDVVHFNLYRRHDWIDMLVARGLGCMVVTHVRSQPHEAPLRKRVLDLADGIICISDYIHEAVGGVGPRGRVRRIYNPVEVPGWATGQDGPAVQPMLPSEEEFVLVAPAVIEPRKGQDDAIRALARLAPAHPKVRLVIAGGEHPSTPGSVRDLETLAADLGVTDRVRFVGHCEDMAALLASSHVVLVLSKRGEALGRVAIEAGLCARPVIVTRAGALPEIVDEGVTGFVVEPGDIEQLVRCLAALLEKPGRLERMGHAARDLVERRFGRVEIGEQLRDFYRELSGAVS